MENLINACVKIYADFQNTSNGITQNHIDAQEGIVNYSDDKDIRILDNEPLIENKKLNMLMTKTKTRAEEDDEL